MRTKKKSMDIFWRIYFWLAIIAWLAIISTETKKGGPLPDDYHIYFKIIETLLHGMATIALFAYTYDKKIFIPVVWKIFLLGLASWIFYDNFFIMSPSEQGINLFFLSIGWLLIFPLYLSVYLYAFNSTG